MSVIHSNIEVCVDCLYVQANGVEAPEHQVAADLTAARWPYPDYTITNNCPDDCEGWFSWDPCGSCGSPLGGERHPAVVWDERQQPPAVPLRDRWANDDANYPPEVTTPGVLISYGQCGCGCSDPHCQV